ncbi:MAG: DUF4386 family protein [Bacteroidota bacterium]
MQSNDVQKDKRQLIEMSSSTAFTIGRTVGILLLLQLIGALTLPFILAKPITMGSPAFLISGVVHAFQIRLAVLLTFFGGALTVFLGIMAFREFQRYSKTIALLFVVVCAISCVLDIVHAATIMSLLSLSNSFNSSAAAESGLYRVVGAAAASSRRAAHINQLVAIGAWMFVFYFSLLRFKLVPRFLGAIGIIGILSQFVGVTFMMFMGYHIIGEMAMPLLPIQIAVSVWLMVRGFKSD